MLNPNVSSSSLSDASQIRYQKAVREISKLIGVNNTIKRDADGYRHACENLEMQNRQLFDKLDIAAKQKQNLDQMLRKYEIRIHELETLNQNFRASQQSFFSASMVEKQRSKHMEQIAILNQKLTQQGNTIINLQQNVAQLQKDNKNMKLAYEKAIEELKKEIQESHKRVSIDECLRCPENKQKLWQSIQYRMVLEKQIIDMKKGAHLAGEGLKLQKNRNEKDKVIESLGQRVRITEEKQKRRNIEVYKLKGKLEKVEEELAKYKDKQRLLETTAFQK